MNIILGGSFASRLNPNLQEAHGFTYGDASEFFLRRAAGPFTARAEVLERKLPGQFETTPSIAARLIPVVLYDLPRDYYNTYVQQVERVTQADVQRVAHRYITPGNFAVVIVGDRAAIEPKLRALNVGDVNLRDLTGRPELESAARRAAGHSSAQKPR